MTKREEIIPVDPLEFIKNCIAKRHIKWTYHVNIRLQARFIPRQYLIDSVDNFMLIEEYPHDKYLPSYLVWSKYQTQIFHTLIAVDIKADTIVIVTSYRPDPKEWYQDFKKRR